MRIVFLSLCKRRYDLFVTQVSNPFLLSLQFAPMWVYNETNTLEMSLCKWLV